MSAEQTIRVALGWGDGSSVFAPLESALLLDDNALVVAGLGPFRIRGGGLDAAVAALDEAAAALKAAGYELHHDGWKTPEQADFLRTEPHPIFLPAVQQ
jgi:hypothetical protein